MASGSKSTPHSPTVLKKKFFPYINLLCLVVDVHHLEEDSSCEDFVTTLTSQKNPCWRENPLLHLPKSQMTEAFVLSSNNSPNYTFCLFSLFLVDPVVAVRQNKSLIMEQDSAICWAGTTAKSWMFLKQCLECLGNNFFSYDKTAEPQTRYLPSNNLQKAVNTRAMYKLSDFLHQKESASDEQMLETTRMHSFTSE